MLKSVSLTAVLTIATTTVLSTAALSRTAFAHLLTADSRLGTLGVDDALVCYMQTAEGRTLNLNQICGNNANRSGQQIANEGNRVSSRSLSPETNLGGLNIHGRGANAPLCFGLDDQGHACPSSR